ncbi:MAG: PQQ-binding-like beta-propeller repeat protein, partial [Deltaproteobacteria bacterium]|nr:PQQ-binding-like beta-propeller repeat protein [Deltaproteobacteria bacterium]
MDRRGSWVVMAGVVVVLCVPAPASTQEGSGDTLAVPVGDALAAAPVAWEAGAAQMVVGVWDTIIAVETDSRDLFALNAADGKEIWRKPAFYSPEKALTHLPATDGKHVWLGLTDTLYGLRARDGKVLFEAPLDGEIEEDLAYIGGRVVGLVSKIEGEKGTRERQFYVRDFDGATGRIKNSINVGKTTQAMFAVDREALVCYTLLRKVDASPTDRFALTSYQLPAGAKLSSGSTGDVNGCPYAAVSRLAVAGPDGISVYLKDSLAKPLNRFGRDLPRQAADVTISGKKAIFIQGDRVSAADVNTPSVFWQFAVDGMSPGEIPFLSPSLFTTVGLRLVFPAAHGGSPLLVAFDSANGKNVRASRGIDGITSTTYFKNLLVAATGKKVMAINLDKLAVLPKKDAPKEPEKASKDAADGAAPAKKEPAK